MMLKEALAAKSAELGRKYTYRHLADDSQVDYSYVSKILRGKSRPSEQVLKAWSEALKPHFPLDIALVSAGYTPASKEKRRLTRRIAEAPAQFVTELEHEINALLERLTGQKPREEDDDQDSGDDEPDTDAGRRRKGPQPDGG